MARETLTSAVLPAAAVDPELEARLWQLHAAHYDGVDRDRFRADLAEKDWVILLRDAAGAVAGFSTQVRMEATVAGRRVRALFSGDTLIAREHWGTQELVRAWCRLAGRLKAEAAETPLYWFLISKGHRTYLYLPLFFREYFPRAERALPPFEGAVLRALAEARYPGQYDPVSGLIEPAGPHDRLKPELDAAPGRAGNPHVHFFLQRNPRYAEGVSEVHRLLG